MKKIIFLFVLFATSCNNFETKNYSPYLSTIQKSNLLKNLNENSSKNINHEIKNTISEVFKNNKNYFGCFIFNAFSNSLATKNLKTWKFLAINSGKIKSMDNFQYFEGRLLNSKLKSPKNSFTIKTNFISNHKALFLCIKQTIIKDTYEIYYFFKLDVETIKDNGKRIAFGLNE